MAEEDITTPPDDSQSRDSFDEAREKIVRQRAEEQVQQEHQERFEGPFSELRANLDLTLKFWKKGKLVKDKTEEISENALSAEEEETLRTVYENLDQQAEELKQIYDLLEREPVWKKNKTINRLLGNKYIMSAVGAGAGLLGGLKVRAVSQGVRGAVAFVAGASPILGGIAGGAVAGGLSARQKTSEKVHSAESWEKDIGTEGMSITDLKSARDLSNKKLDEMTTILANAFRDKKVRDNASRTLALATRFRLLKTVQRERATKQEEATENETESSDESKKIFGLLDSIEQADRDLNEEIIESADEEYKDRYKEILAGKRKEIWVQSIKGAVVGGAVGGVFGYLFDHFSSPAGESGSDQPAAQVKSWLERHTDKVNLDSNSFDQEYVDHLGKITSEFGFDVDPENANIFDPAKYESNDFSTLIDHLIHGREEKAVKLARLHNIELNYKLGGQRFVEYLTAHGGDQGALAQLSAVEQWEMISHPSWAKQIMDNGTSGEVFNNADYVKYFLQNTTETEKYYLVTNPVGTEAVATAYQKGRTFGNILAGGMLVLACLSRNWLKYEKKKDTNNLWPFFGAWWTKPKKKK